MTHTPVFSQLKLLDAQQVNHFMTKNENLVLDSWLVSFHSNDSWKWIYYLLCLQQAQLRTKTNAFIVSLAVADFCVGMTAFPSLFFCRMSTGCNSEDPVVYLVRNLFAYASVMNLCSLVLDRYIAVVKPLKYLTFMEGRRVIQMVSLSWTIPVAHRAVYALHKFRILKTTFLYYVVGYLSFVCFEFLPCAMLIFCFVSMLHVICKRNKTLRSLAKQSRFNHQVFFKTQEKSAVIMMGIVIGLFLLCYGIYLRCTFVLIFSGHKLCNDHEFKIPILVLNSAVNPLAYSFFKRDINKEIKRRICCAKLTKRNKVEPIIVSK